MDPCVFQNWLAVADLEAAGVLMHGRAQRVLVPFMTRECSVGEVALETGISTQSAGYWVRRLETLGLLHVTRTRPRRGRPSRLYRAAAGGFFVPFELTRSSTLEALFVEQERPLTERLYRDLVRAGSAAGDGLRGWGVRLSADGNAPCLSFTPDPRTTEDVAAALLEPDAPALWSAWAALRLDFADAKAFQRELAALVGRYGGKPGAQEYVVRLALAPGSR